MGRGRLPAFHRGMEPEVASGLRSQHLGHRCAERLEGSGVLPDVEEHRPVVTNGDVQLARRICNRRHDDPADIGWIAARGEGVPIPPPGFAWQLLGSGDSRTNRVGRQRACAFRLSVMQVTKRSENRTRSAGRCCFVLLMPDEARVSTRSRRRSPGRLGCLRTRLPRCSPARPAKRVPRRNGTDERPHARRCSTARSSRAGSTSRHPTSTG